MSIISNVNDDAGMRCGNFIEDALVKMDSGRTG